MSPPERAFYEVAGCVDGMPKWLRPDAREDDVQYWDSTYSRRAACGHSYKMVAKLFLSKHGQFGDWPEAARAAWSALHTADDHEDSVPVGLKWGELSKPRLLVEQLCEMAQQDPLRVIVFTNYDATQGELVRLFGRQLSGWKVYSLNSKTPPPQRHRTIREFQAAATDQHEVCIATYQTAAVGITLTAASRVYFFEPCDDAATETQAAGRIHRLGQTKKVEVVRLAFRGTIEEALVRMHDAQARGGMDCSTSAGREQLRAAFRECNVHAPHDPGGEITEHTEWCRDHYRKREYQRCKRCKTMGMITSVIVRPS